jgi:hypothetical protein
MPITSMDGLIDRICDGFADIVPLYGNSVDTRICPFGTASTVPQFVRAGFSRAMPNPLPSGVTGYIPTEFTWHMSANPATRSLLLAECIDLGSLDISGASGTFTDGVAMPTRTELGTSRIVANPVICDVTTILNATPGTLNVTYTDQDGNTAAGPATALTASCPVSSVGFLPLNTGDIGVRDITAATRTLGTTPTGVIRFWGVQPVGVFHNGLVSGAGAVESLISRYIVRRFPAGTTLGLFTNVTLTTAGGIGMIRIVGDN